MIPHDQNNKDKKGELSEQVHKHICDPQEDMEGLVSSLLQKGKEVIDRVGPKKGHIEHIHASKENK